MAKNNANLIQSVTRAVYRAQTLIHSDGRATVDALLASGVASDRALTEALVAVYAPAVPPSPKISLTGIERDAVLYPAHPRAPDFTKVHASDFVAPEFAEHAILP
jgi:hypothetical protein